LQVSLVMKSQLPESKELYSSHIPALKILITCGWSYLPASACLAKRGNTRELILKDELIGFLQTRRYQYKGEPLTLVGADQGIATIHALSCHPGNPAGVIRDLTTTSIIQAHE